MSTFFVKSNKAIKRGELKSCLGGRALYSLLEKLATKNALGVRKAGARADVVNRRNALTKHQNLGHCFPMEARGARVSGKLEWSA